MWSLTLTVALALTGLVGSWTKTVKEPGKDRRPWYRRIRKQGIVLAVVIGILAMANAWVSSDSERQLRVVQEETLDSFYDDLHFRLAKENADSIIDGAHLKLKFMQMLIERNKNDTSRVALVQLAETLSDAVRHELSDAISRLKEMDVVIDEDDWQRLQESMDINEEPIGRMRDEAQNDATFQLNLNWLLTGTQSTVEMFLLIGRGSVASTYINSVNEVFAFQPAEGTAPEERDGWGYVWLLFACVVGAGLAVGGMFIERSLRRQ